MTISYEICYFPVDLSPDHLIWKYHSIFLINLYLLIEGDDCMIAADLTLYSNPVNRALGEAIQVSSIKTIITDLL